MKNSKQKTRKFKVVEIGGVEWVEVSSWEEEQEALRQGYQNILPSENLKKKKRSRNKRWLSGRPRYGRYDGIFEVK